MRVVALVLETVGWVGTGIVVGYFLVKALAA